MSYHSDIEINHCLIVQTNSSTNAIKGDKVYIEELSDDTVRITYVNIYHYAWE